MGSTRRSRRDRGFTLMELLAVIVIIGILVGGVMLSMVDRGAAVIDQESRRFVALLQAARDDAVLQARDRGIVFWSQGYQFVQRQGAKKWSASSTDRVFRPRDLGHRFRLDLYVEGIRVKLPALPPDEPQVFVLSDAEVTPFSLVIADSEARERHLEVDGLGTVQTAATR